jgi:hypothetical protein
MLTRLKKVTDDPQMTSSLKIDDTNKIKKNISDDGLLKLSDRNESPSPNSVSDDSLFNPDCYDEYVSSVKKVKFNSIVTVITENGNNSSKLSSKKDDANKRERKKKNTFIKNLKIDNNNKNQEDCTVKGCSVDPNDYMCFIS